MNRLSFFRKKKEPSSLDDYFNDPSAQEYQWRLSNNTQNNNRRSVSFYEVGRRSHVGKKRSRALDVCHSASLSRLENEDRNDRLDFDRFSLLVDRRSFKRVVMQQYYNKSKQLTREEKEEKKKVQLCQIDIMHAKALDIAVETMRIRYQQFERENNKPGSKTRPNNGCLGMLKENLYESDNTVKFISNKTFSYFERLRKEESFLFKKKGRDLDSLISSNLTLTTRQMSDSTYDGIINKDIIIPNGTLVSQKQQEIFSIFFPSEKDISSMLERDEPFQ